MLLPKLLLLLLLPYVRGRGGRGGASNLGGGGSFKTVAEFEQLQTAAYYVGGSPKKFNALNKTDWANRSLAPPVREQGVLCHTCVGQAVASAVQLSLACNLEFRKTKLPQKDVYDEMVHIDTDKDGGKSLYYDVDALTL
jgi:hypothetical protein